MNQKTTALIHKVWNYAHVLKDDGLAFMDYTEQITYLLFLKMVQEQRTAGVGRHPESVAAPRPPMTSNELPDVQRRVMRQLVESLLYEGAIPAEVPGYRWTATRRFRRVSTPSQSSPIPPRPIGWRSS